MIEKTGTEAAPWVLVEANNKEWARVKVIDTVTGIKESLILTGSLNGNKVTDAAAVVGNVLVQGVVASSKVRVPTAIILLKAAMAHLKHVQR